MSLKRLISMTAVCMLGALALSGTASAGSDDTWGKAQCEVLGAAGTVGPAPEDGVNSVFADLQQGQSWDALELMDTDPGTFTFEGDALCEGVDVASENKNYSSPQVVAPTLVTISASGIYDNLICGTGEAKGAAVLVGPGITISSIFDIQFIAGAGKLSLVVQDGQATASDATGKSTTNDIDQGRGQGVIQIVPTKAQSPNAVPCIGGAGGPHSTEGNVTEFEVVGAFEATLAGEGTSAQPGGGDSDN